jgi:hypothetical protein
MSFMKFIVFSVLSMLLLVPQANAQEPSLSGLWDIEFTLRSQEYRVQFRARNSGEGSFLVLDNRSSLSPGKATWRLVGQSPAIYLFTLSGAIEFPLGNAGRETGTIDFSATSDLALPILSLSGWGQYHPPRDPNDTRGNEDPTFTFTAKRVDSLSFQILAPLAGERVRRGREIKIEWSLESTIPLASQSLWLSLDKGATFYLISPSLEPEARAYTWGIPVSLPKTKKAFLKLTAVDLNGKVIEFVSEEPFVIK